MIGDFSRIKHSAVCKVLSMVCVLATPQIATAIPMSDLIGGGEIIVNDKRFFNWSWDVNSSIDLSAINITGLTHSGCSAPGPGLNYNDVGNTLNIDAGGVLNFHFSYDIEVLNPNCQIVDNSLSLVSYARNPLGNITIEEMVEDISGALIGTKEVFARYNPTTGFGETQFEDELQFDPRSSLHIEKWITLDCSNCSGLGIDLIEFEQRFSQVPEPAILALMGLGLTGIGYRRHLSKIAA